MRREKAFIGAPKGLRLSSEQFNQLIQVGTPVRYYPIAGFAEYRDTKTRSEAWELGHGDSVVKVEGQTGCVSIRHLELLPSASAPPATADDPRS